MMKVDRRNRHNPEAAAVGYAKLIDRIHAELLPSPCPASSIGVESLTLSENPSVRVRRSVTNASAARITAGDLRRTFLRRILIAAVVIAALASAYASSAIWSVSTFLGAVRAGDAQAVLAQTDVPRLRNVLVTQIVDAYLERIGAKRSLQRLAVAAYWPTVADTLIGKIIDEGLMRLLREGIVQDPARHDRQVTLTPLGTLAPHELLELASRVRPVKPIEFDMRISPSDDPRLYAAARFRLEGTRWKLAGLTIPPAVAADIAAMIVEPAGRP
jgi:hypothetical protein